MSRKSASGDGSSRPGPRIGALLRIAWQGIRERIYEGVRAEGYRDLGPAHVAIFRHEGLEGERPTGLAARMQITKQSVNDLLRHLEERGYLRLEPDPADGRARLVRLMPSGRKLEATVRAQAREAEVELSHLLGERRLREFKTTLVRITELSYGKR